MKALLVGIEEITISSRGFHVENFTFSDGHVKCEANWLLRRSNHPSEKAVSLEKPIDLGA